MGRKNAQGAEASDGAPGAQPEVAQPTVPGVPSHQPQGQQGQRDTPAYTRRIGRLTGDVWRNAGKDGPWYSVVVTRSYLDNGKPPQWKKASTLGVNDLLVAAEILKLCWLFIAQQDGSNPNGNGGVKTSEEPIPF